MRFSRSGREATEPSVAAVGQGRSGIFWHRLWAAARTIFAASALLIAVDARPESETARDGRLADSGAEPGAAEQGEFGADLGFLARFHAPPQTPGESNHYIDLWAEGKLRSIVQSSGLTNNHALFVNSHGEALGSRYAFYPHESLLPNTQSAPHYSVQDLARQLGPEAVSRIHNIIIGGCNADGAFNTGELRRHFINATNIVHAPAGRLGYQAMLFQALLTHSANVETLYETPVTNQAGVVEYVMDNKPCRRSKKLSPYVAELFLPGATNPFRKQTAGRELLDPRAAHRTVANVSKAVPPTQPGTRRTGLP